MQTISLSANEKIKIEPGTKRLSTIGAKKTKYKITIEPTREEQKQPCIKRDIYKKNPENGCRKNEDEGMESKYGKVGGEK